MQNDENENDCEDENDCHVMIAICILKEIFFQFEFNFNGINSRLLRLCQGYLKIIELLKDS